MDLIIKRLLDHVSSLFLLVALAVLYILDNHAWLEALLPINGKPTVIFILLSLSILNEVMSKNNRKLNEKVDSIIRQMEVNRLKSATNSMYTAFIQSGEEFIDNDCTIKELSELKDIRERLSVNSYTQERIIFMCSKIKRI